MKIEVGRKRFYNPYFENVKDVIQWEVVSIKNEQDLDLEFISTNSEYRQGIRLAIDAGEGYLECNGIRSREFTIWEDTAPQKTHIKCISEEGLLSVYNKFDAGKGNGGVQSQLDFFGMLVEYKDNIITFRCNEGTFQSDFDKLIFQIELL